MRTTPRAHYVNRNHATRIPRAFIYLDTETWRAREGRSEIQRWRLGVAAFDRRRADRDGWRERDWCRADTPAALWDWVTARCRTKARTVLVAHNLAFDLRISDAFVELPARGWRCVFVRLDGGQAMAIWRKETRTLCMVDSLAWVPGSLEKLGTLVGMEKVNLPADDAPVALWWERCVRDVEILAEVWRRLMVWVEADDLGNWKPTGAGQSWAAYRHRFKPHELLVHEDDDCRAAERAATMTGRTEAWRVGKLTGGPFVEWDFETAYCRIGAECDVPTQLCGELQRPNLRKVLGAADRGRVLAECTVTTEVPTVPQRGGGGISWPVGCFRTTLWDNELALALDRGATVTIDRAWVYRRSPALADFCAWVLDGLRSDGGHPDPVVRLALKHWSRALIGRTAAQWSRWDLIGHHPTAGVSLGRAYDKDAGETFRFLQVGHDLMRARATKENPDAMVSIMGWVMAEARVRLWGAMEAAGLEHVMYVDTDSVIVDQEGDHALSQARLPHFRVKQIFGSLEVFGPRQIVPGGVLRASGVPRGARPLGDQVWEGEVWTGIGRSLEAGENDLVRVALRRFRLSGTDRRRGHSPDGSTWAVRIDDRAVTYSESA